MDLQEYLRELLQQGEHSEDKTIFATERPDGKGKRVTTEITERTEFHGYPHTVKEIRSFVLECGHQLDRGTTVGYCQGSRWILWKCNGEYCVARCHLQCPRCGRSVSSKCCARAFMGTLLCRGCARTLMAAAVCIGAFRLVVRPFLDDEDERQPERREWPVRREQEEHRHGARESAHGDD